MDDDLDGIKKEITEIKVALANYNAEIMALKVKVDMLVNSNETIKMLLQYVVTPCLLIVGAVVGIKLALP
jgi:hypothetical protein